jgi:hypothetical protein
MVSEDIAQQLEEPFSSVKSDLKNLFQSTKFKFNTADN